MGTTANSLPYPENTDPLADMAAAIQALANAVDGSLVPFKPFLKAVVPGGTAINIGTIPWTVQEDTHGAWSTVNKTYTVPEDGLYRVFASMKWNNGAPPAMPLIILVKNGVNAFMPGDAYRATAFGQTELKAVQRCDAGDVLSFTLAQAGMIVQNDAPAENTLLTVEWMRP